MSTVNNQQFFNFGLPTPASSASTFLVVLQACRPYSAHSIWFLVILPSLFFLPIFVNCQQSAASASQIKTNPGIPLPLPPWCFSVGVHRTFLWWPLSLFFCQLVSTVNNAWLVPARPCFVHPVNIFNLLAPSLLFGSVLPCFLSFCQLSTTIDRPVTMVPCTVQSVHSTVVHPVTILASQRPPSI